MRPSETLQIRVPCPVCRGVRGTGPRPHPCGDEVMSGGACTYPHSLQGQDQAGRSHAQAGESHAQARWSHAQAQQSHAPWSALNPAQRRCMHIIT